MLDTRWLLHWKPATKSYIITVSHLVPPVNSPVVIPTIIIVLTCGQDVTVPKLVAITISCEIFNGSESSITTVYKDGTVMVGDHAPYNPTDNDFGTYTCSIK